MFDGLQDGTERRGRRRQVRGHHLLYRRQLFDRQRDDLVTADVCPELALENPDLAPADHQRSCQELGILPPVQQPVQILVLEVPG